MKRIILVAFILIIAIGAWYAYRTYQEKTPDVVNKKADVVITANKLLDAFNRDTSAAIKRFVDKIIEVTGRVKRIDTTGAVVLGEDDSMSEVILGLERRHIEDYKKLKEGSVAVMQGICSGFKKAGGDDLLASLGTTVELRSAGVKDKK